MTLKLLLLLLLVHYYQCICCMNWGFPMLFTMSFIRQWSTYINYALKVCCSQSDPSGSHIPRIELSSKSDIVFFNSTSYLPSVDEREESFTNRLALLYFYTVDKNVFFLKISRFLSCVVNIARHDDVAWKQPSCRSRRHHTSITIPKHQRFVVGVVAAAAALQDRRVCVLLFEKKSMGILQLIDATYAPIAEKGWVSCAGSYCRKFIFVVDGNPVLWGTHGTTKGLGFCDKSNSLKYWQNFVKLFLRTKAIHHDPIFFRLEYQISNSWTHLDNRKMDNTCE